MANPFRLWREALAAALVPGLLAGSPAAAAQSRSASASPEPPRVIIREVPRPSEDLPAPARRKTSTRRHVRRSAARDLAPRRPVAAVRAPAPRPEQRSGESAMALNNRAYRLQRQGRHAEAEPLLRRALALDPDNAYAQYNLGWSLVAQGKAREALVPLQRTAALQPDRWEPQRRPAQTYEQLGQTKRAAAAYARARALGYGRRSAARAATP
jgi:predicted Zn-dependent protease